MFTLLFYNYATNRHCTVGKQVDKSPGKPKSTNAFGFSGLSLVLTGMTMNLSLAPFRAS